MSKNEFGKLIAKVPGVKERRSGTKDREGKRPWIFGWASHCAAR